MDYISHSTVGRKHGPRYNRRAILIPQNYGRKRSKAPHGWRFLASPYDLRRYRHVTWHDWFQQNGRGAHA